MIIEDDGYLATNLSWEGGSTDSIVMVKTDFNGSVVFEKVIDLRQNINIRKTGVIHKLSDGSGYIIGSSAFVNGGPEWTSYLTRVDNNLDTIWTNLYLRNNLYDNVFIANIMEDGSGGFISFGSTASSTSSVSFAYMVEIDANGVLTNDKLLGTKDVSGVRALPTPDGGYLICGFADRTNSSVNAGYSREGYLLKVDSNGDEE